MYKTIKIENLEVIIEDLGKMNWIDAVKSCENLGNGWHLPSIDELKQLHKYEEEIGGFESEYYWSSTEYEFGGVYYLDFTDGTEYEGGGKSSIANVRAVKKL